MKYVYELVNLMGTVEYVGETKNPELRFKQHTKWKPLKPGLGKFYGRTDIIMNVVKEFNNRKEAYDYQCKLQEEYNLLSDENTFVKNFANRHKGYKHSEEAKLKMSKARKLYYEKRN